MKFSIRDLLLVTVIVALAVGWWIDRRRQGQTIEKMRAQIDVLASNRQDVVLGGVWKVHLPLPTSSPPAPNPLRD
jgi:hypothetical protein